MAAGWYHPFGFDGPCRLAYLTLAKDRPVPSAPALYAWPFSAALTPFVLSTAVRGLQVYRKGAVLPDFFRRDRHTVPRSVPGHINCHALTQDQWTILGSMTAYMVCGYHLLLYCTIRTPENHFISPYRAFRHDVPGPPVVRPVHGP